MTRKTKSAVRMAVVLLLAACYAGGAAAQQDAATAQQDAATAPDVAGGEKKTPTVFKSITKAKEPDPGSASPLSSPTVKKTVPVTPAMKIPPHFPHPPAGGSGASDGSSGSNPQGNAESKSSSSPAGAPSTGKGPAGAGSGSGQPDGANILGIGPQEEYETGLAYKKKPKGFKFTFNINDYDLADLVAAIAKITGKKFILSAKVKQNIKATIIAPTPVTAEEAFRAFLSVLQVNGLTIVPEGKFLKVVDSTGAATLAVPTYPDGKGAPGDDRVITRIHKLQYGGSDDFAQILVKFKSNVGDVTSYAPTNSLIITDYASSLDRLLEIVKALDVPGTGEKIWVEPVHYASATTLAQKLQEVMEAAGMGSAKAGPGVKGGPKTSAPTSTPPSPLTGKPGGEEPAAGEIRLSKIIAEERTNSLIIVATQGAYLRVLELIKKLDVQIPGEGDIHVHYLQNADAETLGQTLSNLVQGVAGKKGKEGQGAGVAAGELFEGEIKITSDKATNSLVIISTLRDYSSLRKVIEKLDIPRHQVFVEALIMEVTLQKQKDLGVAGNGGTSFKTKGKDSLVFGATTFNGLSSIMIDPTSLMGLAVGLRGPEISEAEGILGTGISIPAFGVMVNALQNDNNVNILSTPAILATDNEKAEIVVGGNVPVQQGYGLTNLLGAAGGSSTAGALSGLSSSLGSMVSVGRQNVGLTLRITPHINESDQIRLEIELEMSEVTGESSLGPLIDQRQAKTVSVVKDQQTIVIGGLITDNETETIDKVPVLGDIPILGYLFKKKKTRTVKRNLLIFLTPYIIRDMMDFRQIFNQKMEERREFIEQITAFESKDYEPFIDYAKTNGILEEIHKAMLQLEEEQKMLEDAKIKPPPAHKPSDPIDAMMDIKGPQEPDKGSGGPTEKGEGD